MPLKVTEVAGGTVHPNPFIGPILMTVPVLLDVSSLDTEEVDQNGWIKPGVILRQNGAVISGASQIAYGCVAEAVKIAADNAPATLAAAADVSIPVAVWCVLNRDIMEDSLGRALSANELAAVDIAGSHVAITNT